MAFVLWDFHWMYGFVGEEVAGVLDRLSLHLRYGAFSEAQLSLAALVYFPALAAVCAAAARFSFDLRRVTGGP